MIHTCFNVLATAVMLPFTKCLEKLAYLTIRDDHQEQKVELLDERLFTTPGVAVARSHELTQQMAHLAKDTLMKAISLTTHYDPAVVQEVTAQEDQLDTYEDKLGTYLVRLSQRELTLADSRQVSQLLHSISDLERIGDHAANIVYPLERQPAFSEIARTQLDTLYAATEEILSMTVAALDNDDLSLAKRIEPLEQVVDEMTEAIRNQHIERLKQGKCTIDAGIVLLDILTNMERVADHCSNIASAMIEMRHDALDLHHYLTDYEESSYYKQTHAEFAAKYSL